MNKKFSTLLAGVALLSAMSANAQTTPAQNVLPAHPINQGENSLIL